MKNTSPELPIEQLGTSRLIEDLCLALRDVGVRDYDLPNNERAISFVEKVKQIHTELKKRGADFQSRISQLSQETSWQMEQLLEDCLAYPTVIPYVRESDGVRRSFRCSACRKRELFDRNGIYLCDVCLSQSAESMQNKVPLYDLLLFRTYNESKWCKHADSETVLMAFDDYDSIDNAWCQKCIIEEQERRTMLKLEN